MTLLNVLLTSSVVALGVLINSASPANALVAHGHGLKARSAQSPNHNGFIKRKRSSHKNRKRCVQQQPLAASSSDASVDSAPSSTDSTPPADNTPAPANYQANPAQACGPGAKVGLAWGQFLSHEFIPAATTAKTCWYYTWNSYPADSSFTGNLKFVPMLSRPSDIGMFQSQVINTDANYGIVFGMNEVNQNGQSLMSESDGVDMWNRYLVPLKARGYTLISPSTTSAPSGIEWMKTWLAGGLQAQPDALAFHWYGTSFPDFQAYVESFANAFPNFDLWITEFGCTNFQQGDGGCDTMAFANQAIPYLDGNPRIKAYFPFAFEDISTTNVGALSTLMDTGGHLTDLGRRYIN